MSFTRRSLLGGLGLGAGAGLFAPFMRQLAHAGATGPKRFVFVLEGNCAEAVTLLSTNARRAIEATTRNRLDGKRWFHRDYPDAGLEVAETDFAGASALDRLGAGAWGPSLAPHATVVLGLSSTITGGGHSTSHGALGCNRSSPSAPAGITIDQWLAERAAVRGQTPFSALRLGVSSQEDQPLNYETCAYGAGRAAAMMLHPRTAYNALFGSVASATARASFQQRSSLLDFAREDVNAALRTFPGNSRERAKLEGYLSSLEAMIAKQQRILGMGAQLTANLPEDPMSNPLFAGSDPMVRMRAQFQLATAALKGDLTNVVVLGSGAGNAHFNIRYPSIHTVARHDLQHGSADDPAFLGAIHASTRELVGMVLEMARALMATPEPSSNGTMLDHTLIVFMSDNGEQHHSTASDWPFLLLGGGAMGLKPGGRTLVFPRLGLGAHRQVSNLYNTLGFLAGEELTHFGLETAGRVAAGPLAELMV